MTVLMRIEFEHNKGSVTVEEGPEFGKGYVLQVNGPSVMGGYRWVNLTDLDLFQLMIGLLTIPRVRTLAELADTAIATLERTKNT